MRSNLACIVVALVILSTGGAADQESLQTPVRPVRIDAVVTDPQGGAITGLRASDFEVREDGVPRPIQTVEFRWVPRHSAIDVLPIETRRHEERAARQPGTRVFALFLDEFHVSPGANAERAREAVENFLDNQVFLRDLAAVIRPLDSPASVRFTRDRSVLHGSLAAFAGRKGDYTPRTPMEEERLGRAPGAVRAARDRIVNANLRDLGVRLGELNADRAALVLVTEGLGSDRSSTDGRLSDLESLVRASSQFHFPIYTFNPAASGQLVMPRDERERADASLRWLATETGGLFVQADAFIRGFARVFHDTHGYYALTYQPAHADARFHKLEVRTRAKAQVRTRASYWAAAAGEWSAPALLPPSSEAGLRRVLRRSARVDVWLGVRRDSEGRADMVVTWEARAGQTQAPEKVAIKARTLSGNVLFDGITGPVGATTSTDRDSARFQVPPGRVELDMTVLDGDGNAVDTDARDFDVPDLLSGGPGPVLLPVEIVRTQTLREFQTASVKSDATPSSARTFTRANRLLVRVPAYDPSGIVVHVTAQVLSRTGQPMRAIEPAGGLRDGVIQFALPLGWLSPGRYQIEVSGQNANGSVKERVAFQVE